MYTKRDATEAFANWLAPTLWHSQTGTLTATCMYYIINKSELANEMECAIGVGALNSFGTVQLCKVLNEATILD